jgi:hypothetical protein
MALSLADLTAQLGGLPPAVLSVLQQDFPELLALGVGGVVGAGAATLLGGSGSQPTPQRAPRRHSSHRRRSSYSPRRRHMRSSSRRRRRPEYRGDRERKLKFGSPAYRRRYLGHR